MFVYLFIFLAILSTRSYVSWAVEVEKPVKGADNKLVSLRR